MNNILEIENVTKLYGTAAVLQDINLEIRRGSIHGLVGRNGSGKTMLLKCICGLVPVTSGEIRWEGKVIGKDVEKPDRMGALIEGPGFLEDYNAMWNLRFLRELQGKADPEVLKQAIRTVGLNPDDRKKVGKYSMGMKQRLGIAQAIMEEPELFKILKCPGVKGLSGKYISQTDMDFVAFKEKCEEEEISMTTFESLMDFSEFKTNEDGLIPVIVQHYRTQEVLMMAYMNEEAFDNTIKTGRMTYYSRSRKCQWIKGETSGHYQYVKSLTIDCDKDTLLAKVDQVGAACHTGNPTCFFQPLVGSDYNEHNPLQVFESVYNTITDRREHPKEGSYTNYLFDKGIDKILKKVGEEATEIIIAAKNPNPEEIKYEMADFLYHAMVLMVERGVSWDDIVQELADR